MKIALCDDDNILLFQLSKMLRDISTFDIVLCRTGFQLLELIDETRTNFDAIFLDIKMPFLSGIETAEELQTIFPNVTIVIMTAYKDLALESLHLGALHYLLKPLNQDEVRSVIDKIVQRQRAKEQKYIRIATEQGCFVSVSASDILYAKSMGKKLLIQTYHGSYECYYQMSQLEQELDGYHFYRTHRSYLVNLHYVDIFMQTDKTAYLLNNETIPISKYRLDSFSDAWDKSRRHGS